MTVHLDDASVTAIAERVVELMRGESIAGELIDAAEVARRFSLSRDYVYEHADELGAVRIGSGPRARLRFNQAKVAERLGGSPKRDESQDKVKPVRPVRTVRSRGGVTLLPIRGKSL